ncbi:MAG TPA: nucleotidyl transferase AbiEii/AbiGii toxin family protein [Verrucomicrobiae bacterium]
MSFAPNLAALPVAQRAIWPELKEVSRRFVLYGGTALALRLGHRQSEDFDFFADAPVNPDELLSDLPVLAGATIRQKAANTLTVMVNRPEPVKISFFGLRLRRTGNPEWTEDRKVQVASQLDIAGCKMAVIQTRAEIKDYLDIEALLDQGIGLGQMLGAARAIYGEQFSPLISLKALAWFNDGSLPALPERIKERIRRAAGAVEEIPDLKPLPGGILPPTVA